MPRSRKKRLKGFYWIIAAAVLVAGGAGWIWWISRKPAAPAPKRGSASGGPVVQRMVRVQPPSLPKEPTNMTARVQPAPPPAPLPSPPPPPPPVTTNFAPIPPAPFPRPVQTLLEAQVALARRAISPGSLDGLIGTQTRAALRAFQAKEQLAITGELDEPTEERLRLASPLCTNYTVTSNDLARLQPLSPTWLGKSQQTALDYETILELIAEKGWAHPNLIRRLNPSIDWTGVEAGTVVRLPDVAYGDPPAKAAFARISLSGKSLEAFDPKTNLLVHFPCSIAQRVEKRPIGELHVAVIAPNPNYTFDPDVFPESEEARRLNTKLVLPPGPNNPVGVAWIGLDKPGYGIHGTPSPEQVGRTESHGCFRLANWNAEYLVKLVWIGMPVYIEP